MTSSTTSSAAGPVSYYRFKPWNIGRFVIWSATSEKQGKAGYTLMFAGSKAEEISGMVQANPEWQRKRDEGIIGFGGKR